MIINTKKILIALIVLFALLVISLLVLVFLDPFNFGGINTSVEKQTSLKINSGEVVVNGSSASDGLVLKEGDEIEASEESDASVVFFDDSISRLKPGTKLKLEVLNSENFEIGESEILINLETGEVWSKVQKQTSPDISFQVKTVSVNAAIRGSALDVSTDGISSTVFAVEHTVKIESKNPKTGVIIHKSDLTEGKKAEIIIDKSKEAQEKKGKLSLKIGKIAEEEKKKDWFKKNENEDKVYQEKLKKIYEERKKKEAGALPGTFGYNIKSIQDKVRVITAGEEKEKVELKIAKRKIIEAELLFQEGKDDFAKNQISNASKKIKKLAEKKTPQIERGIKEIIQENKRLTRDSLPGEEGYDVKKFLNNFEIEIAPEEEKQVLKTRKYETEILDLHDMAKQEGEDKIDEHLERFREEVVKEFTRDPEIDFKEEIINNPYLEEAIRKSEMKKEKLRRLDEIETEPGIDRGEEPGLPEKDFVKEFFNEGIEKLEKGIEEGECGSREDCPENFKCIDGFCRNSENEEEIILDRKNLLEPVLRMKNEINAIDRTHEKDFMEQDIEMPDLEPDPKFRPIDPDIKEPIPEEPIREPEEFRDPDTKEPLPEEPINEPIIKDPIRGTEPEKEPIPEPEIKIEPIAPDLKEFEPIREYPIIDPDIKEPIPEEPIREPEEFRDPDTKEPLPEEPINEPIIKDPMRETEPEKEPIPEFEDFKTDENINPEFNF